MAQGVRSVIGIFKSIPAGKRISFLITFVIVAGGFITLFIYTGKPNYVALFTGMNSTEASKVVEKLNEKGIKYDLMNGTSTIMVPRDKVYELKMYMAANGIVPKGGSVGFEILDDMSFGTTDEFKIRYQQALQGELERTIKAFPIIDNARVHIVTAGDSPLAEKEKPATASVVVKLYPGKSLNTRQLQGIINIVTHSVKGLRPENVSIVDMEGGILTKVNDKAENHENYFQSGLSAL